MLEKKISPYKMIGARCQRELGSCPPTETGRDEVYRLKQVHFRGKAPRFLRKAFLGIQLSRRFLKDLLLKGSERSYNDTFSKVNALEIGRSEA